LIVSGNFLRLIRRAGERGAPAPARDALQRHCWLEVGSHRKGQPEPRDPWLSPSGPG
jgi:hypothetical protein